MTYALLDRLVATYLDTFHRILFKISRNAIQRSKGDASVLSTILTSY